MLPGNPYSQKSKGYCKRLEPIIGLILLSKCKSEKEQNELFSACEMLITNEQMGGRFKFVAITPEFKEMDNSKLPGFTPLPGTPYAQEKTV
ncbi:unnamed protein product [Trichobilharzia regenti]|nr:unnamed protein product [Trichobilharzia regenti]